MTTIRESVFLSPHPDDIAFSLGAALLGGFFPSGVIVNVFSLSRCTIDDADDCVAHVTRARKSEDQSFFSMVGHLRPIYLDHLDAPLRLNIPDARVCDVFDAELQARAAAWLQSELQGLLTKRSLLLAPLGLGGHVDHLVVHEAACSFLRMGWATAFYEDLPYAGAMGLPDIDHAVQAVGQRCGAHMIPHALDWGCPARLKADALGVYRSQLDESTTGLIIGHGRRIGGGHVAERIWCDRRTLRRLLGDT